MTSGQHDSAPAVSLSSTTVHTPPPRSVHAVQKQRGGLSPRWHAVAGFSAGFVATAMLYPADVIKVRLQSNDGTSTRSNIYRYSSMTSAFRDIFAREGIRGYYAGLGPALFGSSMAWGIYFYAYTSIKETIRIQNHGASLSMGQVLLASSFGGFVTSAITNPIWVVKTNMILNPVTTPTTPSPTSATSSSRLSRSTSSATFLSAKDRRFASTFDCVKHILQKDGVAGLYKGMVPSLLGVSQGAFQFMFYERFRQQMTLARGSSNRLSDMDTLLASSVSKILAVSLTYPLQVFRTRLQQVAMPGDERRYSNLSDLLRKISRSEGWRGFYRGISANILRVLPANCITFIVYERLKSMYIDSS